MPGTGLPRQKGARRLRLVQLIPNLMTLGALCAGLTAMRFAFDGNVFLSVALIALAAMLDGLDGAMARLLKSESALGAELDSLADFVNFGVAPGLLLYHWALQDSRSAGWIAVLIYAVCCALRLGRYNISARTNPGKKTIYFQGVPAPGGALLVLLPVALSRTFPGLVTPIEPPLAAIWLVIVGLLMIARFATPSLKLLRIKRENAPLIMVGMIALAAALFTWPWTMLLLIEIGYLAILIRAAISPPKPAPDEIEDDETIADDEPEPEHHDRDTTA